MAMERYRRGMRRRLTLLGVMEALFFLLMRFGRSAAAGMRGGKADSHTSDVRGFPSGAKRGTLNAYARIPRR